MTITSPQYSFIHFDDIGSPTSSLQILPFIAESDLMFQFKLTVPSEDAGDAVMVLDIGLLVVDGLASITDGILLAANTLHDYGDIDSLFFIKYRLSPTQILFYWPHGLPTFTSFLSIGQCFKLAVIVANGGDIVIGVSNLLKVTDDAIFTTQVAYKCSENSNNFIYCVDDPVPNVVRISFYLKKIPQFPSEESTYQKSNGAITYLKSITKKEYSCITDYMDAPTHEKLNVAISSDSCMLAGDTYSGGVVKNGAYEIDPLDVTGDIDIAQAKFKVFATPYNVRNNNCGTC